MATALQQQIEKYQEEAIEYEEAKSDAFNAKADFSIAAIGKLMENLVKGMDELTEVEAKATYYDKELCGALKDTVTQLVDAFSKIKSPVVNIAAPRVSIDLKPLESGIDELNKTNKVLIGLVDKFSKNGNSDELYKLIIAMIAKQNSLMDKGFQQINYKEDITKIIEALRETRPELVKLKVMKEGYTTVLVPEYKNNK